MDEKPIITRPYPVTGKATCIYQGDTIPEMRITFGASDGVDLTGATIKMDVFWGFEKQISITTENNGGITINNNLSFTIDARPHTEPLLPIGEGKGDIQITYANGTRTTLIGIEYLITKHYTL